MTTHITVCICTYKRPALLSQLLDRLAEQQVHGEFSYSITVADNDQSCSAETTVRDFAARTNCRIDYCVEPRQNIALARNRAIAHANGEFIAFIDDDELPAADWLLSLRRSISELNVDAVLGPVRPYFRTLAPEWFLRGGFCYRPEYPTGRRLHWRETRTGNVLLRTGKLKALEGPFRQQFGSGSEDTDFFHRFIGQGASIAWCQEAVVSELVPPERWKRTYLLKKALLRGQNQRYMAGPLSTAKSLIAVPIYALALPFTLPIGQHLFMRYCVRLCDHAGKLFGVMGWKPAGDIYVSGSEIE